MKLHRCEIDMIFYELSEPTQLWEEVNVDVPEGLYARYKKAFSEYHIMQYEISKLPELDIEPTQNQRDMLKEVEKLTAERDKLINDRDEIIEALKEFIALHPSLFGNPYNKVHAKLKTIAG